jgi:hypothetical protein
VEVEIDHARERSRQLGEHGPQQVVRHRPGRRDILDLQRDGVRLDRPDPDRRTRSLDGSRRARRQVRQPGPSSDLD